MLRRKNSSAFRNETVRRRSAFVTGTGLPLVTAGDGKRTVKKKKNSQKKATKKPLKYIPLSPFPSVEFSTGCGVVGADS